MTEYRWIVRIPGKYGNSAVFAREVTTDGPHPDEAIIEGLKKIAQVENNLWMRDELTVMVERVR